LTVARNASTREIAASEDRASNVVEAVSRVMSELPAIGRDRRAAQEHGGYAYRGIDQITSHVSPLLAKHGVVLVPQVEAIETPS